MRSAVLLVLAFTAIAGVTACSLLVSLDGLTSDTTTEDPAEGGPEAARDGTADGDLGDGGLDDAACPGTGGPTMVRVPTSSGSYCIDRTEVTNAQYAAFLAASATFDRSGLPARCASHGPFVPVDGTDAATFPYPAGKDDVPVGETDWCDAYAFCLWAGKRLCGRIGGGGNPQSAAVDPNASQWYRACSFNASQIYPYGNVYDGGVCNGRDRVPIADASLLPVASEPGCAGGYPGIFDMVGNVEELEDSCDDAGACYSRGGSFVDNSPNTQTRCDALTQLVDFGHHSGDIGFRCCGP